MLSIFAYARFHRRLLQRKVSILDEALCRQIRRYTHGCGKVARCREHVETCQKDEKYEWDSIL